MFKHEQGYKLTEEEILQLMLYALDLLKEFGRLTDESITKLDAKLDELASMKEEY